MIAGQEDQSTVASRLQMHIDNICTLTNQLTDSQLEALDYSLADVWSAFGFPMIACGSCRDTIPEALATAREGRSYCHRCARKEAGYPTTRNRRRRTAVKYRGRR